jgi:hypothetical protein
MILEFATNRLETPEEPEPEVEEEGMLMPEPSATRRVLSETSHETGGV